MNAFCLFPMAITLADTALYGIQEQLGSEGVYTQGLRLDFGKPAASIDFCTILEYNKNDTAVTQPRMTVARQPDTSARAILAKDECQ